MGIFRKDLQGAKASNYLALAKSLLMSVCNIYKAVPTISITKHLSDGAIICVGKKYHQEFVRVDATNVLPKLKRAGAASYYSGLAFVPCVFKGAKAELGFLRKEKRGDHYYRDFDFKIPEINADTIPFASCTVSFIVDGKYTDVTYEEYASFNSYGEQLVLPIRPIWCEKHLVKPLTYTTKDGAYKSAVWPTLTSPSTRDYSKQIPFNKYRSTPEHNRSAFFVSTGGGVEANLPANFGTTNWIGRNSFDVISWNMLHGSNRFFYSEIGSEYKSRRASSAGSRFSFDKLLEFLVKYNFQVGSLIGTPGVANTVGKVENIIAWAERNKFNGDGPDYMFAKYNAKCASFIYTPAASCRQNKIFSETYDTAVTTFSHTLGVLDQLLLEKDALDLRIFHKFKVLIDLRDYPAEKDAFMSNMCDKFVPVNMCIIGACIKKGTVLEYITKTNRINEDKSKAILFDPGLVPGYEEIGHDVRIPDIMRTLFLVMDTTFDVYNVNIGIQKDASGKLSYKTSGSPVKKSSYTIDTKTSKGLLPTKWTCNSPFSYNTSGDRAVITASTIPCFTHAIPIYFANTFVPYNYNAYMRIKIELIDGEFSCETVHEDEGNLGPGSEDFPELFETKDLSDQVLMFDYVNDKLEKLHIENNRLKNSGGKLDIPFSMHNDIVSADMRSDVFAFTSTLKAPQNKECLYIVHKGVTIGEPRIGVVAYSNTVQYLTPTAEFERMADVYTEDGGVARIAVLKIGPKPRSYFPTDNTFKVETMFHTFKIYGRMTNSNKIIFGNVASLSFINYKGMLANAFVRIGPKYEKSVRNTPNMRTKEVEDKYVDASPGIKQDYRTDYMFYGSGAHDLICDIDGKSTSDIVGIDDEDLFMLNLSVI